MKDAKRGYYCLIQYCPDPGRLEAANVGVVPRLILYGEVCAMSRMGSGLTDPLILRASQESSLISAN